MHDLLKATERAAIEAAEERDRLKAALQSIAADEPHADKFALIHIAKVALNPNAGVKQAFPKGRW